MRGIFRRFLRAALNARRWDVLPVVVALLLMPFLSFGGSAIAVAGASAFMFGRMLLDAAGREGAEQPFVLTLLALVVVAAKLGVQAILIVITLVIGLGVALSDSPQARPPDVVWLVPVLALWIPFPLALVVLRALRRAFDRAMGGAMGAGPAMLGGLLGLLAIQAGQFACHAYWLDRGEEGFWVMAFVPLLEYLGWAWLAASAVRSRDRRQGEEKDA